MTIEKASEDVLAWRDKFMTSALLREIGYLQFKILHDAISKCGSLLEVREVIKAEVDRARNDLMPIELLLEQVSDE